MFVVHSVSRSAAARAVLLGAALLLAGGTARAQQGADQPPDVKAMSAAVPTLQVAQEAPAPEPGTGPAAGGQAAEPPKAKPSVDISGFVMLDAIHDFHRVDPNWGGAFRPSKILVDSPLPNGMSTWSVRQSKLNFQGQTPTSAGTFAARFEFDLYGVGPDEGQTTIRVRHVYGEMGHWLFGQTNSVFMDVDVFPNVIDYWGPAGELFYRVPMARYTSTNSKGRSIAVSLENPNASVDSGKVNQFDPTLGIRAHTEWPVLAAHYRQDGGFGHYQLAGGVFPVGFESATSANGKPEGQRTGWGVSASVVAKVIKKDKIYAQFTYGDGISSWFNDGGVDLAPNGDLKAETVTSIGYQFYYEHPWNERWMSSIGYSQHRQNNIDGQTSDAFKLGQYASINLLYTPAPNILLGGELLWGRRENKGGADGSDTRLQFSAKYNFSSR
jgi:hypothetical protein